VRGTKGCLLLWDKERPSRESQPFTRKTCLPKEKAKAISIEEIEEIVRNKDNNFF